MYMNEGAVVESCISQALVSNGYRIHFYSKPNSSLKMDFVISYKGHLTALETRSGKTKISRSLLMLTSGDYKVGGSKSQTALWVRTNTGYSICRFSHPTSSTSPA